MNRKLSKLPKRILVAPLNWGLGHATRCVPIIRELEKQGAEVFIASDGGALKLLREEFPHLPALTLPSYNIRYHTNNMVWNIAWQMPRIWRSIQAERSQVKKWVEQYNLTGIISDHRYGCRNGKAKSIFLTHQINIKIPFPILEKIARRINRQFIRPFDECWVPDVEGEPNLSGVLSHHLPYAVSKCMNVRYLGALSRMEHFKTEKKYDVIAVLSGPEPQRTKLEQKLFEQARQFPLHFLIVQGKTEEKTKHYLPSSHPDNIVEVVSYLTSQELNEAILSSNFYIGRSGYSTVMDLVRLKKPALLIPTPGQTEQEYLALRLQKAGYFTAQFQGKLDLEKALEAANELSLPNGKFFDGEKLSSIVFAFLNNLSRFNSIKFN